MRPAAELGLAALGGTAYGGVLAAALWALGVEMP